MIWKKLSVNRTAVTIVILLSQLSTLSVYAAEKDNEGSFPEKFPPARREPQGKDFDMLATATDFILQPMKVNFTENNNNNGNLTLTNVTLMPSASTNVYSNKSRIFSLKKPAGLVLTLSLRPSKDSKKDSELNQSSENEDSDSESSEDDIISTTLVNDLAEASFGVLQNHTSKAYSILDRLKNLTNLKITKAGIGIGTNYGVKSRENKTKLKGFTRKDMTSSKIKKEFHSTEISPENLKENDSSTSTSITKLVSSEEKDTSDNKTLNSKAGGHLDHSSQFKSFEESPKLPRTVFGTAPIILKRANLTRLRQSIEALQNKQRDIKNKNENPNEEQVGYETRTIITADQVGGNRPTSMPFHFTTTTEAPSTTTEFRSPINRYNKLYSPHNHIYAPTQDPVGQHASHEDLNVEDFQDFRVANLVFGSKVGAQVSTYAPEAESAVKRPPSSKSSKAPPSGGPSYSNGRLRTTKPPLPPPPNSPPVAANLPQSASSGVKNSHVRIVNNNNNNDNLPFYKEPGGVFKEHNSHKYNDDDNDDESNHINDRTPTVKYSPRIQSNSHQPPSHSYKQNSPQNYHQHYQQQPQAPPSPGPAYITATQQPIYQQPIPAQPVLHPGYNYPAQPVVNQHQVPQQNHVPYPQTQNNYYPVQQNPVPYFPTAQQQPVYNNPPPNRGFVPVLQPQVYQQPHAPQPLPAPPLQPVYNTNPPTKQYGYNNPPVQNVYNPPPRRYDPETDDYYGDPLPTRDKSKSSSSSANPRRKKPQDDEEDHEEDDYKPPPPRAKPKPPPRDYPKRQQSGRSSDKNRHRDRDDKSDDDEDDDPPPPPPPPPRRNSNNNNRRPSYDDYDNKDNDGDHQDHVGDYAQQNNKNHRPLFDDSIPGPNTDFADLDSNFNSDNNHGPNNNNRQRRPFNPSPEDYGPIRPSRPDNSPNFDHPNIQYPTRGRQQNNVQNNRPEYDPRGFGIGYGPPLRQNLPLDPIYTQTIKQYDETTKPRPSQNSRGQQKNREPERDEEPEEEAPHDDEDHEPEREERRPPPRRKQEQEEEEEEEPPPEDRKQTEEEEEEPEEEEEEETQNKEITPEEAQKSKKQKSDDKEEEEEEEEEEESEERPKRRHQERKNQEPKKPPPKKPQQEKSGNLDEDIIGIEREFGGIFEPRGPPSPPVQINGGFHPQQR